MLMRSETTQQQPRALGSASLQVKERDGTSHIDGLRQSGALKLLFPRSSETLQAISINTAGGITGGDCFDLQASALAGSSLCLTTQAAERAYCALPGPPGRVRTRLSVSKDARLHWLPQETILYDGAAVDRQLDVILEENSRFLMVEPILFGRMAMGEDVRALRFDDQITVTRDRRLLYRDGMVWRGDVAAQLDRPAIGDGARAIASLLYVAPDASAHLAPVRQTVAANGGASLLAPDVLVARAMTADGFALRRVLLPVLDRLTRNSLPPSWRL
ncbi:MAG: urease accessory protein UreD [Pseudomonadota bacterium]